MNQENPRPAGGLSECLPYLTSKLSGVGGSIKNWNEDFVVEEIPRYEASGEGDHVFFMIEKQGLTTPDAIRRIGRALGRKDRDIGYAGLKDAKGVTRQVLSVEHVTEDQVMGINVDRAKVLWARRHGNKLRVGHLAGNRFTIRIRDAQPGTQELAKTIAGKLIERGMPNYFGLQRFGSRGTNALVGRAAWAGDFDEAIAIILGRPLPGDDEAMRSVREQFDRGDYSDALNAWPHRFRHERSLCRRLADGQSDGRALWRSVDRTLRKLFLSAFQSSVFNQVVGARIGELDRVVQGDLAWLHRNGACFEVVDLAVELLRCEQFEISPSGPLFGKKMTPVVGDAQALELTIMVENGVVAESLTGGMGDRLTGARRPLRVPVSEFECEGGSDDKGEFLQLKFSLPPGSYATSFLREICKT